MDLIFNELSFSPLSNSIHIVENKFSIFMNTFKVANKKYGVKNIKFQSNIANQQVTNDLNFVQSLENLENKDLKRSLFTFLKPPYLDDLAISELEEYCKSDYEIAENDCPKKENPVGLPIAYIKSELAISLDSHIFWQKRIIKVRRKDLKQTGNWEFPVYNICFAVDVNTSEIIEWSDKSMIKNISDKEALKLYIGFTRYEPVFMDSFFDQLMEWKKNDQKLFKFILLLMKDVQLHPFTGGMGQTENLRNRGKEASKRITNSYPDGDRLSYFLENNVVTFIACKGHYEFH